MNQRWTSIIMAIGSCLAVAAFPSAAVAQQSRYYPEDETALCAMPASESAAAIRQHFESAWYDLDKHGRALTGRMNKHSATYGSEPLPERGGEREEAGRYKIDLQRLIVSLGALFPYVNRPMDLPLLTERLATHSVPMFDPDGTELQIAVMENYLAADREQNGSLGAEFVNALAAMEDDALALESGRVAPQFHAHREALYAAFHDFLPALKASIFSANLEQAIQRRLAPICKMGNGEMVVSE